MSGGTLATVECRAVLGLSAPAVRIEVHLSNGLPAFTLVGLADTEVKEARERVRSAILSSGLEFPNNKRITVNLAPADLPKDSGRFDLPIALGILAASGQIELARLAGHAVAGELSLSGELRHVRGALAMALALHKEQRAVAPRVILPMQSAREAALVPGLTVFGARHLLDVVAQFAPARGGRGDSADAAAEGAHGDASEDVGRPSIRQGADPDGWVLASSAPDAPAPRRPRAHPDLADVKGQQTARRALEIAAAGGHSILLSGPPGAGKSMLAERLAGLLPEMTVEEALESAAIASLSEAFAPERWGERRTCAPHHSSSAVALVGGGVPPRPGEISLAHHGVLFLDELPEFPRSALEALREPLETGAITIARAARRAEFPARFQLVAAMNPCPCGWLGAKTRECRCTPEQVARYHRKLSGPLLDRIDLHVEVAALSAEELLESAPGESSATVRQRAATAREQALERQGTPNSALSGSALDTHCALDKPASAFLQRAATRLNWSGRGIHRTLKVARTIADLAGASSVGTEHLAEAAQYRCTLRLTSS